MSQTAVPAEGDALVACRIGGLHVRVRWPGASFPLLQALTADYDDASQWDDSSWLVSLVATREWEGGHIRLDVTRQRVDVHLDRDTSPADAVREAVVRLILAAGRLPAHGAVISRTRESTGVLLVGKSGDGKSSLVHLAVASGWLVMSDDLVSLWRAEDEVRAAAIRRRLRIVAESLDPVSRALGRRMISREGVLKIRIDPEALRPGSFLPFANIGEIVFLERAAVRAVTSLTTRECLERLIAAMPWLFTRTEAPGCFKTLSALASRTPARVARLTAPCLQEPRILDALAG